MGKYTSNKVENNFKYLFFLFLTVCINILFAQQPQEVGQWSDPIEFGLVPVSVGNLPDGKLIVWASKYQENFGGNDGFTYYEIYDPYDGVNGRAQGFKQTTTNHDMFCPGINNLPDGRLMITGGSSNPKTTFYDHRTQTWSSGPNLNVGRGYQGNVTLSDGSAFTFGGSWSGGVAPNGEKIGEVFTPETGWKALPGLPSSVLWNENDLATESQGVYRLDNHSWLWAAPNGKIFHAGPGETMHWLDTTGEGSWSVAGKRADDTYSMKGTTIMFDVGKILKVGGAGSYAGGDPAKDNSYVIDINNENNVVVSPTANKLEFSRTMHNSNVLPNGEVIVTGGLSKARVFTDNEARLNAEIYNPQSNSWRTVAGMQIPRTYHSVSILMMDGRVFAAGGGLCGSCDNHTNAEVFSPPYLFDQNGNLAERPVLSAPEVAVYNSQVQVSGSSDIQEFAFIRMSSATHSTNNEQRRVPASFTGSNGNYAVNVPGANIMPPGYYMLFAINSQGVPSIAEAVRISDSLSPIDPVLDCSGADQVIPEYNINGTWLSGQNVIEVALGAQVTLSGLPNTNTYAITGLNGVNFADDLNLGAIDESKVGVYTVTNQIGCSTTIEVRLLGQEDCTGKIIMERFNNVSGTSISALKNNDNYPNSPSSVSELREFSIPVNAGDNYGARVKGLLKAPETGTYYFWASGDDNVELNLSSDSSPLNINRIAYHTGWTGFLAWNKYTTQKSGAINLVAGQNYYIEALMNEGGGLDNLSVGWRKPSDGNGTAPIEVIPCTVFDAFNASPILVTGVSVTPSVSSIEVGDTLNLIATVLPENATNRSVTWSSSDTSIATVNTSGLVSALGSGSVTITVTTNDGGLEASSIITVDTTQNICEGKIIMERYDNVPGNSISELKSNVNFPESPSSVSELNEFRIPINAGNNYGVRVKGLLKAPETGVYYFWISGDDNVELNLSSDSNSLNINRIAYHNLWSSPLEWNKFATQKSGSISLVAGQNYYIEGLMNEGGSLDNLSVGWRKPSDGNGSVPVEVIPCTVFDIFNTSPISVASISVTPEISSIEIGDTLNLVATVLPENATNKSVTWSSSDTSVVTVSSTGLVSAEGSGSATITVTTIDGNFSSLAAITVNTVSSVIYCNSNGKSTADEYIGKVVLGAINNTTRASSGGYGDFTHLRTTLTVGVSNKITITPVWTASKYREGYAVWIDYNRDGDFNDSGERVWSRGRTTRSPVSGSFVVPNTALSGETRMRVSLKYNARPKPCESFNYGEVEDYTVKIIRGEVAKLNESLVLANDSLGLKVYPNPFNDEVFVIFEANHRVETIELLDVRGRVIFRKLVGVEEKQLRINFNEFNYLIDKGVYVLRVKGGGNFKNIKLIKK